MSQNVVIYEQYADDFGPLGLTRPVYALRVGMTTLAEKIAAHYPDAALHFHAREYLAATVPQIVYFKEIFERRTVSMNSLDAVKQEGGLLIDGAVIASLSKMPSLDGPPEIGVVNEKFIENGKPVERVRVVYGRFDAETCKKLSTQTCPLKAAELPTQAAGVPVKDVSAEVVVAAFPWDLVMKNGKAIVAEYQARKKKSAAAPAGVVLRGDLQNTWFSPTSDVSPGVVIDVRDGGGVYVGDNVEIQGNVTLDARGGPIFIEDCGKGEKTIIESQSLIQGPVYIGKKNMIKQATVREGSSFGPVCRIGGEIEETIIIGYSNKQHYGFMGHAVIGEWVNWGAGTVNSDLKNDYSNVVVELSHGRRIDSGQNKTVGCFIGDHTKTGLSTLLNTGTVVGVMSNVLMNTVTEDKYLPSFCIYVNGTILPNRPGVKIAETVMGRRNVPLTPECKKMLDYLSAQMRNELREFSKAAKERLGLLTPDMKAGVDYVLETHAASIKEWQKQKEAKKG